MNTIKNLLLSTNKTYHVIFVLLATIFLPFMVHLLPSMNGIPIGAILLPMFYISIPSLYLFKDSRVVALGVGLAPLLNHLVTGKPDISLMIILTFELVVYSFIVGRMLRSRYEWVRSNVGGFSYLLAKIVSSLCLFLPYKMLDLDADIFFFISVTRAFPGIVLLFLISNVCYKTLWEHD